MDDRRTHYTVASAALALGLTESAVRELIDNGTLRASRSPHGKIEPQSLFAFVRASSASYRLALEPESADVARVEIVQGSVL